MRTEQGTLYRDALIRDLRRKFPNIVSTDISLATMSRWRIGGIADVIVRPRNLCELANIRKFFWSNGVKHVVVGSTSNLLFDDSGLSVPCIQIGSEWSKIRIEQEKISVDAGAWVPKIAYRLMKESLTGGEHICGIPGTIGGLIYMNGGSQRRSISDSIVEVLSVSSSGEVIQRLSTSCDFSYRSSIFQCNDEIIATAILRFAQGDRTRIRRNMLKILKERRLKFPQKFPNCGSVFKANSEMYDILGPPGAVIESLGLKGISIGKAIVSHQHANFILNQGGAKATDVLRLVSHVKERVYLATGFLLDAEGIFMDSLGNMVPLDRAIACGSDLN